MEFSPFWQVENLMQKYDWIAEEKQYFGQANSAYDFTQNDPQETSRQISKLQVSWDETQQNKLYDKNIFVRMWNP